MGENIIRNNAGTVTEIYNNKKIVIDPCDGVLDFDEKSIIIKSGRMKIEILGAGLKIILLSENIIAINGFISSVNYNYL